MDVAATVSWLGYALVWCGLGVGVWTLRAVRGREWTPRDHIAAILVASIGCQVVLDGFTGRFRHPHYENATWIAFVLFAWFAVDAAAIGRVGRRLAGAATALLSLALATAVAILVVRLHETQGTRDIYGPTLANQQRVARELARYSSSSPLSSEIRLYESYPNTLAMLRQLNPPPNVALPERQIQLRYASADPAVGAIELVAR